MGRMQLTTVGRAGIVAFLVLGVSIDVRGASLSFGSTVGQPGEVVEVPVIASFERPLRAFYAGASFDEERLEFLGFSVAGTAAEQADPLTILVNLFPGQGAIFGVDSGARQSSLTFSIPPAEDVTIGRLRFRIRADAALGPAPVEPAERVVNLTPHFSVGEGLTGWEGVTPDLVLGSSIDVTAPVGPRPVGDPECVQFLDRVVLSFTPTEPYEQIAILRDGATVAMLPGDATGYEEELVDVGRLTYAVIARAAGSSSIPADCELFAVTPAAPGITDLVCQGSTLRWSNPVAYDRIVVFRDGEPIDELDGTRQSYSDPLAPTDLAVYTVIGELDGFRSPDVSCMANGLWILELGDVQVPVDATRVEVPIFATTSETTLGFDTHMEIDTERFTLVPDVEQSIGGTVVHPETEFIRIGMGLFGVPAVGMIFDFLPPVEPEKRLPVGLRQHVFSFILETNGTFRDGETLPVRIVSGAFTIVGSITAQAEHVGAVIRFGSAGPPAVEGLEAAIIEGGGGGAGGTNGVRLAWRNGGAYESLRIERNGTLVAQVSGQATDFVDENVLDGAYTYKVVGVSGEETSFPASTFLATVSPPGAFLRSDATHDGVINLADPMATLQFLFRGGGALPCEDAADADDNGRLNLGDPVLTLTYLFRGGVVIKSPGTRYPWFDPTEDGLTCNE